MKQLAAAFLVCTLALPVAQAQKAKKRSVVLAPVSSLSAAKPKALTGLEKTIEAGLGSIPQIKIVTAKSASDKANKAKRPELRSCEGNVKCLAELGTLVSVQYAIYAEVGGLGDARVVYLKLVDVAKGKEIRSTTIELSKNSNAKAESAAAAARLLTPESYVGTVKLEAPVKGAIVYLDGQKRGTTPTKPIEAPVGSHALRVTHPEHRDYVRFVDIEFGKATNIKADLQPLPGVSQRLAAEGVIGGGGVKGSIHYKETPWYLRWYTITGGGVGVAIVSAVIFGALRDDINANSVKDL